MSLTSKTFGLAYYWCFYNGFFLLIPPFSETDDMPTDPMVFRWGRTDCDDSPSTSEVHEFPEPTMDRSSMMDYFSEHYDMNENEVGEQKLRLR